MAANDYTRTVNITPLGISYSWDTPPSWITINQVGTSNDWIITVAANSGTSRSATLTVRHSNTTTTDTISVSQAGGTVITPTATPVPPTATLVPPTPTPTSGSGAGPTPTPTSGSGAGPTPTPTSAPPVINNFRGVSVGRDEIETLWDSVTGATGNLTITWGINGSYTNVGSGTSYNFNDGSFNLESLQPNTNYYIRMTAANADSSTSEIRMVKTDSELIAVTPTSGAGAGPTPTPTSGSGAGPTPTPTSGSGAGPTPTPTSVPVTPTPTTYVSTGGGGGGGCHLAGDLLTLANGETKKVEDIVLGDTLLSLAINGLSDVETIYREFNVSAADYSDEYTTAVVNDIYVDTYSSYYDINNGELQLTLEHPVLVLTSGNRVVFKVIKDVLVGDSMLNQNNEWILVNSNVLVQTETPFTTYAFNVENKDVYFASGILVHNVMDDDVLSKEDSEGGTNKIQE
jgi:hypothetical protein